MTGRAFWVRYITYDEIEDYRAQGWTIRPYQPGSHHARHGVMARREIMETVERPAEVLAE